jgi:hypothetical protein
MASDRHDARGRRFTVATTKNRRLAQKQLDLFRDTPARSEEPLDHLPPAIGGRRSLPRSVPGNDRHGQTNKRRGKYF